MTTVVWFKRDLRVEDHQPLVEASSGPVICLYIYEAEVVHAPDHHGCHLAYVNRALELLDNQLRLLGARLVTRHGNAVDVLDRLHTEARFDRIVSHQETGNGSKIRGFGGMSSFKMESCER